MKTQKLILFTFVTIASAFLLLQGLGFYPLNAEEIFIGYTLIMAAMCGIYFISIPSTSGFTISVGVTGIGIPILSIVTNLTIPAEAINVLQIALYLLPSLMPIQLIRQEFFINNSNSKTEPVTD